MKLRVLTFLLPLLLLVSCGGSSSDDNGPPNGGACINFTPSQSPASDTVASREGVPSSCDRIAIELIVTDVNDIFAADFTMSFDSATATYDGYDTSGSILTSDGTQVTALVNQPNNDQLVLSVTRLGGAAGGVDAVGQHRLLRLYFRRRTTAGTANVTYVLGRLFDDQVQEIQGVTWHGGTLVVR
jgi:hypothetical protein